jgi:lipopolysaccharide export LptBFGC system permease protein LptF
VERGEGIGLTPQAVWLRDGNRILRADAAAAGGITLFELDEDFSLVNVSEAASARAMPDGGWQLDDVQGTRLAADRVATWHATGQVLELASGADFFSLASVRPDEMSLADLRRSINYLDSNDLDGRRHRFAFWGAIARLAALPLAALLALPLVMGRLRGAENAARASAGLALGLVWYIAQRMVESGAMAFGISPSLMALLPTALLSLAVLWLMSRLPRVQAG